VEPGAETANRLLGGPLAVELEVGPDLAERKSGQEFGDASGPDADIDDFLVAPRL